MKKITFLATVLITVLLSSSCSKEDNGAKTPTAMRYVKSIIGDDGSMIRIQYDPQHRAVEYQIDNSRQEWSETYTLTYEGNTVKVQELNDAYTATYQLDDRDHVTFASYRFAGEESDFTLRCVYDSAGNLIETESDDGYEVYTSSYTWVDGNRYNSQSSPDSNVSARTYSPKNAPTCNIDLIEFCAGPTPVAFFLGNLPAKLLESDIRYQGDRGSDGFRYAYEFDDEGYVSRITVTEFVHVDEYNDETTCRYTISYD